jgi:hypothetical protein
MKYWAFITMSAVAAIGGCASHSSVVATGPDTYVVTGQADLGPNKNAAAREAAVDEATRFCATQNGKRPIVSDATNEDVDERRSAG